MAHPSFVDADEIRAIERPLTIAAAEIDHVFSEDKRHETERILKEGKKIYQITLYSGVEHGFAVRSEMSKKEVKYAKEATFLLQVQWFREWLKEA
jgi:dienelactone hydrolase